MVVNGFVPLEGISESVSRDSLDSISLPDICSASSECHTSFCHSSSDLIIIVHCSGASACQEGEFINNFQFSSIHSDGWFILRFSMCYLVYNLCIFVLIVRLKLSHDREP